MVHPLLITLQSQPSGSGQSAGGGMVTLFMFGAIILVFYFFMIRPQQKRAQDEKKFQEALDKGTKVVTIGGIYGRIVSVDDLTVLIEVDNNVKLKMDKAAIRPAPEIEPKKGA